MTKKTPASTSLKSVVRTLRKMAIGERAWFWFCTEASPSALMVTPLRDDPAMRKLGAEVERLTWSAEARPVSGIVHVAENGTFSFGSISASPTFFEDLADWVIHSSLRMPELEILKNSVVLVISNNGQIIQRIEQEERWLGMAASSKPGSIEDSLRIFHKLKKGEQVWFWMTDSGPDGQPYFLGKRVKRDPKGEAFAAAVSAVRRRSPSIGKEFLGSGLQSSHSLLLTAKSGSGVVSDIFQAIHSYYGDDAAVLTQSRVFKLKDGKQKEIAIALTTSTAKDELPEEKVLAGFSSGEKLLFWFAAGASGQDSTLLLESDKSVFKERMKAVGTHPNGINGSVRMSSKGVLEFKSKDTITDFISALAKWADHHLKGGEARQKMIGSRFIQQSSDGTVLSKQKDQKAWSKLT